MHQRALRSKYHPIFCYYLDGFSCFTLG